MALDLSKHWKTTRDLLEEDKVSKKQELSRECQQDILHGFTCEVKGEEYRFSYDREAQTNMAERWQLFQNNVIESIVITGHKAETDEAIRLNVTKPEYENIYMCSVKAKEDKISRLREMFYPMVDNAQTKEDLELILWSNMQIEPEEPSIVVSEENLISPRVDKAVKDLEKANSDIQASVDETNNLFMSLLEFMVMVETIN